LKRNKNGNRFLNFIFFSFFNTTVCSFNHRVLI
jgi:hypothetical protein